MLRVLRRKQTKQTIQLATEMKQRAVSAGKWKTNKRGRNAQLAALVDKYRYLFKRTKKANVGYTTVSRYVPCMYAVNNST